MPSMNGVAVPVAKFLEQTGGRIPTLAGVKYSFEDLDDFEACVRMAGGRFDVLLGRDELLLDGLRRGAVGAVGSTYNYAAPLYRRIIELCASGDRAQAAALQKTAVNMIEICGSVGVSHLAASKTLMAMLGIDCGPVRLPLVNATVEQIKALHLGLNAVGFRDYASRPLRVAA
jgi:N-acetylneuraminate lyase